MKLGELIQQYRKERGLSQRQFATACSLSNGYIAMLERGGLNPKTNQPITPTLIALKKISDGMRISLSELLSSVDDMQVTLKEEDLSVTGDISLSSAEQKLLANYRLLNKEGQEKLLDNSIDLVSSGRYSKTTKPQILPKETSYKIAAYGAEGTEESQPPIKEKTT